MRFIASPAFSTSPSGSYSRNRLTDVWPPPRSSKVTEPAFVAPSVAAQATFRSGSCSRILASHIRRTPAISATHSSRSSAICVTLRTPLMNRGNSSNCVHWLYALLIGTFTSTVLVTWVVMSLLLDRGRRHLVGAACLTAVSPGLIQPATSRRALGPGSFRDRSGSAQGGTCRWVRACSGHDRRLTSSAACRVLSLTPAAVEEASSLTVAAESAA